LGAAGLVALITVAAAAVARRCRSKFALTAPSEAAPYRAARRACRRAGNGGRQGPEGGRGGAGGAGAAAGEEGGVRDGGLRGAGGARGARRRGARGGPCAGRTPRSSHTTERTRASETARRLAKVNVAVTLAVEFRRVLVHGAHRGEDPRRHAGVLVQARQPVREELAHVFFDTASVRLDILREGHAT
jgi:hypothetical protein